MILASSAGIALLQALPPTLAKLNPHTAKTLRLRCAPQTLILTTYTIFGATATFANAHADPGLLGNLLGGLGLTPQSQALRTDLQKGFGQFQPLLSAKAFATCLNDIVSKKGIPSGYVCVDSAKNTLATYRTAFNTYLEQFVGTVPPNVVTAIQVQEKTIFGKLGFIPPANDLNNHINNAIASVVASTSGETVTAIERFEDCFAQATKDKNLQTTRRCLTGPQSGVTSLFTLLSGVTQQFVGYLPPNVVKTHQQLLPLASRCHSWSAASTKVQAAIKSIAASTSGNSATLLMQASNCLSDLLMSPDPFNLKDCVVKQGGPIFTLQVWVDSIIQQAFGYLPPTLVIQLEQELAPAIAKADDNPEGVDQVFEALFKTASLGPRFVTCVQALEDCINNTVLGTSNMCDLSGKCAPLPLH
ncbi:BZ3500_MvSof-1268-A1-R1_Chr2-1g04297 [Microbotryum saponariae]|uniref:BZ3500_MvSof-1268-A1-R1_Chr2-1g04297 protein n=1 Tax=Microbotryum saponariae TaxID=289078 RepID=A0A2X0KYC8_9BASI|nr:BZ3500_MvSof-1268-A1-R1_Chr2-1g04297 [Microbotryum saponariae]SCZ91361.1 BZ3501_MvSof-1269-A2-R1_Chr2-1g03953 [Microbotryum saponariae]